MLQELFVCVTGNTNPYENLALEEMLLRRVAPGQCILYLWQNRNTVVIGRNQNAWAECRVQALEAAGGFLARRLSGGGAVYHDLGNLNFTFLTRRKDYDVDRQLSVLQDALRTFDLDARKTGRNDVTVHGRKCSGNAFYQSGDCCYHHGTILVDVDTQEMSRFLQVSRAKLESKGVGSVRARVVNLSALNPEVTVEALLERLPASFARVYGLPPRPLPERFVDPVAVAERAAFFASWQWRLGAGAPFLDRVQARFPWGGLELCYTVREGTLRELQLYSDGMEADFLARLPALLAPCRFTKEDLERKGASVPAENELQRAVLADCVALLCAQIE